MFLAYLKQATHAEHMAVERAVDLDRRLRSAHAYRRLLERFWGFYAPLEARLAAADWARYDFAIQPRLKAHRLARDLVALGVAPAALAGLPRCPEWAAESFLELLGSLYVLEGATLGGQIIARQARQTLGLSAEHGCAFFSSYGADVGPMWLAFRELLARAAADAAAEAAIVRGARATFHAFEGWLTSGEAEQ